MQGPAPVSLGRSSGMDGMPAERATASDMRCRAATTASAAAAGSGATEVRLISPAINRFVALGQLRCTTLNEAVGAHRC